MKKRILSILLSIALLLSLLPVGSAAETETLDDLWSQITALEMTKLFFKRSANTDVEAYAALADDVAALVMASELYVEGTCTYDGENAMFFWETTDGEVCGYSPRLRARLRETAIPDADPEEFSGIETVSYASRGGYPSSADVAVFQPYYGIDSSFTTQYKKEGQAIAKATGGTATTYLTNDATIDAIADALESCAVVMFDSHGDTDYASGEDSTSRANTSYICLQNGEGLTSADKQLATGTYSSYYHAFYAGSYGSMKYYCVDGTAIANHMEKPAPNSLLWMAICLGMATTGLHEPLRAKGVETAYGYSQSVTFTGDYEYEEYFWDKMRQGVDVAAAISYMKSAADCNWDPAYSYYSLSRAQSERCAFPIVVSSEDVYPGHGNVDNLQTVYSKWVLQGSDYTFTAKANDPTLGTVEISGNTVIATPEEGARVAGCTLTPEDAAEVTQNGNQFVVKNLTADCELTVNFEVKTPAVVHYSVPDGCTKSDDYGYIGEPIDLFEPKGKPTDNRFIYNFVGWTTAPIENTAQQPTTYTSTYTPTEAETTLYALYRYNLLGSGWRYSTITAPKEYTLTARSNDGSLGTVVVEGNVVTAIPAEHAEVVGYGLTPEGSATVTQYQQYQNGIKFVVTDMTADCELTVHFEAFPCYAEEFTDTSPDMWYHEALDFVVNWGLMDGVGGGRFSPDGELTRAMFATVLHRVVHRPEGIGSMPFTDVEEGSWYYYAVLWAYETGVVNGTSETTFSPDRPITREQVAVMLYRYVSGLGQNPQATGDLSVFTDADQISDYAVTAMQWAVGEGILSGKGDGILDPLGTATRAQIAQILFNWLKTAP